MGSQTKPRFDNTQRILVADALEAPTPIPERHHHLVPSLRHCIEQLGTTNCQRGSRSGLEVDSCDTTPADPGANACQRLLPKALNLSLALFGGTTLFCQGTLARREPERQVERGCHVREVDDRCRSVLICLLDGQLGDTTELFAVEDASRLVDVAIYHHRPVDNSDTREPAEADGNQGGWLTPLDKVLRVDLLDMRCVIGQKAVTDEISAPLPECSSLGWHRFGLVGSNPCCHLATTRAEAPPPVLRR